jgi:hypothetical protein
MTISYRFTHLDSCEAAILDNLSGQPRIAFEKLCADYKDNFRPMTPKEHDAVYCIATLRWGIDRVRACEETARAAFNAHGYISPKMKIALDEMVGYGEELNQRYEYYFSAYWRLQDCRAMAAGGAQ